MDGGATRPDGPQTSYTETSDYSHVRVKVEIAPAVFGDNRKKETVSYILSHRRKECLRKPPPANMGRSR